MGSVARFRKYFSTLAPHLQTKPASSTSEALVTASEASGWTGESADWLGESADWLGEAAVTLPANSSRAR